MVANTARAGAESDTMPEVSQGFIGKRRSASLGGEDKANADNDARMSDVPTPLLPPPLLAASGNGNMNTTFEVQAAARRGGEDVFHSESVLAERPPSSSPVSSPLSPGRSVSGMSRAQSDKGQYRDQGEMESIKKLPPTAELASTTCTLGSGPTIPPLINVLSCFPLLPPATVTSSPPVTSPPSPLGVQETTDDTSMEVCDDALPKIIPVPPAEASVE